MPYPADVPPGYALQGAANLHNVRKRYPNGAVALDGVSFLVNPGEIVVLLGTSGSGKTTALKTLNRLVSVDEGLVSVEGRDVRTWDPVQLRRRIGYVIQEIGLLPHLTVEENIGLVPRLLGWDRKRRAARARELLTLTGLDASRMLPLLPKALSGGERQRVAIARALAAEPPLLLMDEPFGALDPLTRRHLQEEFHALQRRLHTAVVLVTHDVPEALRLADRIVVFDKGRIAQSGTPTDIRDHPAHGFVASFVAAAQ